MSHRWKFIRGGITIILILYSFYLGSKVQLFADTMSAKYQEKGLTKSQIDQINEPGKEKTPRNVYVTGWNQLEEKRVKNRDLGKEVFLTLLEVYGDMTTLISTQEGTYLNLELKYKDKKYPASITKAELGRMELPTYTSFTEGNLYAGVARLFMGFPFLIIWLLFVRRIYVQIKQEQSIAKRYFENVLLCIVGGTCLLILIKYSVVFSSDYVPSNVSNFAFWGNKWKMVYKDYLQLQFVERWSKEFFLLKNMKQCMVFGVFSTILLWKNIK